MKFGVAEVMGARTRYLHDGSGPPLLLLHGVGLTCDSWFLNLPALAKTHAVYAPDLLDNGFTEAGPYTGGPPQPLTLDHLVAFADHMGLENFSVLGSSLGTNFAALLYFRIPRRIDKLLLVGPGSALNRPGDWKTMYQASHVNGRSAIEDPTYENCRARMGRAVYDPACIPDALLLMQMTMYAMPGALQSFERRLGGLRTEAALRDYEIRSRLGDIRVPTLVLLGRQDPRGNFEESCEGASLLPDGKLVVYDRCGHWPHIEHPAAFNRDVAAFLA